MRMYKRSNVYRLKNETSCTFHKLISLDPSNLATLKTHWSAPNRNMKEHDTTQIHTSLYFLLVKLIC